MEHFGDYFKKLREGKNLTLRDVEKETKISNAYLSQLESGKIKQPSPTTLYKLAGFYGVSYELLMAKVGYPALSSSSQSSLSEPVAAYGKLGHITTDEEQELMDYLNFIRNRKR